MEVTLSQSQIEEIKKSISTNTFKLETEVQKLVNTGMDASVAKDLVITAVKDNMRQQLFERSLKKEKSEDAGKIANFVVIMVSIGGPVFGITSVVWYLAAIAIAGAAGYFGYRDKPGAGILASIVFVIAFPFSYHFYLSGRSSFIKIEMLIPLAMAIIPALVTFFGVSKLFYSKES
jgi:hypothetical protein